MKLKGWTWMVLVWGVLYKPLTTLLGTCLGPPGVKLAVAAAGNSAEQERKNKKKGAADDATALPPSLPSFLHPTLCAPMASAPRDHSYMMSAMGGGGGTRKADESTHVLHECDSDKGDRVGFQNNKNFAEVIFERSPTGNPPLNFQLLVSLPSLPAFSLDLASYRHPTYLGVEEGKKVGLKLWCHFRLIHWNSLHMSDEAVKICQSTMKKLAQCGMSAQFSWAGSRIILRLRIVWWKTSFSVTWCMHESNSSESDSACHCSTSEVECGNENCFLEQRGNCWGRICSRRKWCSGEGRL